MVTLCKPKKTKTKHPSVTLRTSQPWIVNIVICGQVILKPQEIHTLCSTTASPKRKFQQLVSAWET